VQWQRQWKGLAVGDGRWCLQWPPQVLQALAENCLHCPCPSYSLSGTAGCPTWESIWPGKIPCGSGFCCFQASSSGDLPGRIRSSPPGASFSLPLPWSCAPTTRWVLYLVPLNPILALMVFKPTEEYIKPSMLKAPSHCMLSQAVPSTLPASPSLLAPKLLVGMCRAEHL